LFSEVFISSINVEEKGEDISSHDGINNHEVFPPSGELKGEIDDDDDFR
jgi:hypothetical protein